MTEVTQGHLPSSTPSAPSGSARALQPLVHELASLVQAPALLLSDADGQVRPGGVTGWYVGDVRLLDVVQVEVTGSGLDLVGSDVAGARTQRFTHVARSLGDAIPDPTVRLERRRTLGTDRLHENIEVVSTAQQPVDVEVVVRLRSDLAPMAAVKQGGSPGPAPVELRGDALSWRDGDTTVHVEVDAAGVVTDVDADAAGATLTWRCRLGRGERAVLVLRATASAPAPFAGGGPAGWDVALEADDLRVRRVVEQGLGDLEGLLLRDGDDQFLAAGSPWFLTLFGRDSLWAARMLVPLDVDLAMSTLRVLARRQGVRHDPATEEEPGKILHEVRAASLDLGEQVLPPVYFGSVDATPLFVCTLADAHDWGADPAQVAALLPAVRACLEWVVAASAETGWLRYVDHTGRGLANQGWKDSHDSVQHADGRLARAPIALVEVQAYAHEAAVRGAALLAAHGADPVPGLGAWTADLRERFARHFWVGGPDDGHLAIALDRDGHAADSLTSNLGHVLGTGVLAGPAVDRTADLLVGPLLRSGFGLRTLASDSPRFSPLSYHGGAVWPHDTAIAVRGLAAEGRHDDAALLAAGVLAAAEGFAHRLPELWGGDAADGPDGVAHPTAYPAACRPQAWSAAAPLAMLLAVTGLRADAPAGVVSHPARTSSRLGAFALRGLRVGRHLLDVRVEADGAVQVDLPEGSPLRVQVTG